MKERLRHLLARRQKRRIVNTSRVPSAVLVPLFHRQGQYHLLFIKRTETVKEHKGQISFPGGTLEKKDKTPRHTALRECQEEIGLWPEDVEVLGELDDELTATSNYIVSPYVGLIPWPYQFRMNQDEVAELIEVPVSALLDRSCRQPHTETPDGGQADAYAYHYQGRIIWGATARILSQFLDIFSRAIGDG